MKRRDHEQAHRTLLQQTIAVISILVIIFLPLIVHRDGHASHDHQIFYTATDHGSEPDDVDDHDSARCCHPVAGCAGIVLTKPPILTIPFAAYVPHRRTLTDNWQSRQDVPDLKPPIL